jgi:hypothetical protein
MNAPVIVRRLFDWKVRGFRWVEIIGVLLVAAMVFSVYVAKAGAARESAMIGDLERQIADNRQRVRLLRAESTRLEQPGRLEALSRAAGLAPVDVERQAEVGALDSLKAVEAPAEVTPRAVYVAPVEDEPPALPDVEVAQ